MTQNQTKPVESLPTAAAQPQQRPTLLALMAAKYNMDPAAFANTVRKTAMPGNATNEEFAAFMMVAKEYNLNPILREIWAFPKKGGGIQPIISIDGWISLINQHPQCDGYEFEWEHDDKGEPFSCKCIMHRKDRRFPVVVEEFLSETIRNTEPWKMKHRMLRHKALIQAARYAFGFSGIMTEDEAEDMNMRDITPGQRPPRPSMADFQITEQQRREESGQPEPDDPVPLVDPETGEVSDAETDAAAETFGPPEAWARGRADRDANLPKRAPIEWRDNPAFETLAEAWFEGWDERDAELALEAKTKNTSAKK